MAGTKSRMLTTRRRGEGYNPIPIILIGVGVTWLTVELLARRRAREAFDLAGHYAVYEGYDEDDTFAGVLKARAAAARARVARAFDHARDGLAAAGAHAAEGARDRAADLAHAAQAKAGVYGRAARRRLQDTVENEPLVLGALGLALGAAIASALPSGRREGRSTSRKGRWGRRGRGAVETRAEGQAVH